MDKNQQRKQAEWILAQVASINPYNRQGQNDPQLYNLYTAGFLAAYLAAVISDDTWAIKRFQQHIAGKGPAARPSKRT